MFNIFLCQTYVVLYVWDNTGWVPQILVKNEPALGPNPWEMWVLSNVFLHKLNCGCFDTLFIMTPTAGAGDRPLAEIRINRITIHSNPLAG
ncbi:putative peptidylprolyl isomerase [Helianthus annuus]|nr:putative peptidylprolyl isomerase [Helianthus annuus]